MANLIRLAARNIAGSAFRSWIVFTCAVLVAGFALGATVVIRGAQSSLNLALDRLGADIVVVPAGTEARVESALLMATTTRVWMPEKVVRGIAAVPGVARVSPQLYLSTLKGASCCSVEDMFMIAYDPATDFTLEPWLTSKLGHGLSLGEAVGGTYIFVPEGEQNIKLYGYFITLMGNMEPTGTGLDQTMFLTFETARDIARLSTSLAEQPLEVPDGQISAAMVKVAPGADVSAVALQIMHDVPAVTPIESPNLFQAYRKQISGLLRSLVLVLSITWALLVAVIGLIFSMAAHERRRELGVLRALGATRSLVLRSILAEAAILAGAGATTGVILSALTVGLFRHLIITTLGIPFLYPAPGPLLAQVAGGLVLALATVSVAALIPALKISHQDPAVAMRE